MTGVIGATLIGLGIAVAGEPVAGAAVALILAGFGFIFSWLGQ